jgi:hypothetical protein
MRNPKTHFFAILLCLAFFQLHSCKEKYWPELDKYEDVLVVDGMITNKPGPYTVRLSVSAPIDSAELIPFTDCQLIISDDIGNTENLIETEPGVYMTSPDGLRGIIGRKYQLQISSPEGENYTSAYEELKAPVGIDSVYGVIEYRQDEKIPYELVGYQFYLDAEMAEQDSSYFLWRADATYHYQSDFTIRWYYDGTLNWFHGPDSLYNCWKSYRVARIFTGSTQSLNLPKIDKYALHYVNTESRQLSVRYSLFVQQLTISEDAYEFWNGIEEQSTGQESLYATQPFQISGNVRNIDNDAEPVLGYFMVAGISEKRIFMDRPPGNIPFHYSICELDNGDFHSYAQLSMADPVFYPIYAIETPGGRRAVPSRECVDCRRKGGTITKPDFWVD